VTAESISPGQPAEHRRAAALVDLLFLGGGVGLVLLAIAMDRAWLDRHVLPHMFLTRGQQLLWWAVERGAVLIAGLVLSQMAASVTPFFERPVPAAPVGTVRAAADLMRQVSPGVTADEADRLALASASRGELLPAPIANADTTLAARVGGLNFQGDVR